MSDSAKQRQTPRAMIHRRIMDAAADRPDASLGVLADVVPGASPELVERVLDEYGDPADESGDTEQTGDEDEGDDVPALAELSEKQRETIHAIRVHPVATQRELGDILDVTAATISQRVSGIPGFDWSDRAAFADTLVGTDGSTDSTDPDAQASAADSNTTDNGGASDDEQHETGDTADPEEAATAETSTTSSGGTASETITIELGRSNADTDAAEVQDTPAAAGSSSSTDERAATASDGGTVRTQEPEHVERLTDRIASLESTLESVNWTDSRADAGKTRVLSDPDLVAKVVRACMHDDDIDESEEREIIAALMN